MDIILTFFSNKFLAFRKECKKNRITTDQTLAKYLPENEFYLTFETNSIEIRIARKINFQIRNSRIETLNILSLHFEFQFHASKTKKKKKKKQREIFEKTGESSRSHPTGGGWILRNGRSATLTTRRSFTATSFAQSVTQKAGWIARAEPVSCPFFRVSIFTRRLRHCVVAPTDPTCHRFSCGPRARPIA